MLQCLKDKQCNTSNLSKDYESLTAAEIPAFDSLSIKDLVAEDKETIQYLQEAHLVWEQLRWLLSMSRKMLQLAASVKLDG